MQGMKIDVLLLSYRFTRGREEVHLYCKVTSPLARAAPRAAVHFLVSAPVAWNLELSRSPGWVGSRWQTGPDRVGGMLSQ